MSTRIDAFIIWGHGLPCAAAIMDILRKRFDILLIHKHQADDVAALVNAVYACDSYPIRHLRNKTRYLLSTPDEIAFILVRNYNVSEMMVGKGQYRKPQCMYVQSVKTRIRGLFNPSGNKEHHVIHGTDYEGQVHHLLKIFGLKKLSYYLRNEGTPFPYHIDQKPYMEKEVETESLMCSLAGVGGYVPVKDSPHYLFALGHEADYRNYFERFWGKQLKEDHWPERFYELMHVKEFNPIVIKGNVILDGLHRAAILLARGEEAIDAYQI